MSEIDGGHGVLVAVAAAAARGRSDSEGTSQEAARTADFALQDEFADAAAGNDFAVAAHFRINLHFKPQLAAHLLQTSDIAFGLVSEMEVGAFMHFNCPQLCF